MTPWRLKSLPTWLFFQQLVQAHDKENANLGNHWLFVRGIYLWPVDSFHSGQVIIMRKAFPFSDFIMEKHNVLLTIHWWKCIWFVKQCVNVIMFVSGESRTVQVSLSSTSATGTVPRATLCKWTKTQAFNKENNVREMHHWMDRAFDISRFWNGCQLFLTILRNTGTFAAILLGCPPCCNLQMNTIHKHFTKIPHEEYVIECICLTPYLLGARYFVNCPIPSLERPVGMISEIVIRKLLNVIMYSGRHTPLTTAKFSVEFLY